MRPANQPRIVVGVDKGVGRGLMYLASLARLLDLAKEHPLQDGKCVIWVRLMLYNMEFW